MGLMISIDAAMIRKLALQIQEDASLARHLNEKYVERIIADFFGDALSNKNKDTFVANYIAERVSTDDSVVSTLSLIELIEDAIAESVVFEDL